MFVYSSGSGRRAASFSSGSGGIGCLVFGVIGMVVAYFVLKGLFKLLYWASPVLFVLALVINWRAVVDTLKNWLKTMETNPLGGLLSAALAVLLFPVFALFLFIKALGYNKIEQMQREFGTSKTPADEFTEFEELESTPKGGTRAEETWEPPVLPEKEPEQQKGKGQKSKGKGQNGEEDLPKGKPENPYDEFFQH